MINFEYYQHEGNRLKVVYDRSGIDETIRFAKATKDIYRSVVLKKIYNKQRRYFIESYLDFKRFVANTC